METNIEPENKWLLHSQYFEDTHFFQMQLELYIQYLFKYIFLATLAALHVTICVYWSVFHNQVLYATSLRCFSFTRGQ